MGKDGNGIYNLTTKKLWKSATRMPKEANVDGGILFHTRYATKGLVKDYNCQPFDNERYVLTHNGHFYQIKSYARLLGFPFSEEKYSDSYLMSYVLEKVGILSFYNAFRDKSYGVIVVYDKKTDSMYLLKTGGSFERAKLTKTGIYIYGSSALKYWDVEESPTSFTNGLFKLNEDGFIQLDKIENSRGYIGSYSGYGSGYGNNFIGNNNYHGDSNYYGNTSLMVSQPPTVSDAIKKYRKGKTAKKVEQLKRQRKARIKNKDADFSRGNCPYCGETIEGAIIYKDFDVEICRNCYQTWNRHSEEEDTEPVGIGSLFPDKEQNIIPKECCGCNWIYKRKCWFGGAKHDEFAAVKSPATENIICNTLTCDFDITTSCRKCKKSLQLQGEWSIYEGEIVCKECIDYAETWGKECSNCLYTYTAADSYPCKGCWGSDYPCNWKKKSNENQELCLDCYYENEDKSNYPCKYCRDTKEGMSEWTSKYNHEREFEDERYSEEEDKDYWDQWDPESYGERRG